MSDQPAPASDATAQFPAAILNIVEAATHQKPKLGIGFGISKERFAETLRELAKEIERGAMIPQKLSHDTHFTLDDWVMHHVTFVFAVDRSAK